MITPAKPMRGFSLVELMVGVVLAIIASIVMFQVFAFSERQRRTVTGASDAQTNGAIAIDSILREVRMAGFGTTSSVISDCNPTTTFSYHNPGGGAPVGVVGTISQPVRITNGASNAPDTISILVSASDTSSNFTPGQTCLRSSMTDALAELNVTSTFGCGVGNLAVLVQKTAYGGTAAGSCTIMEITQVQAATLKIKHDPAQGSGPSYNPPTPNNWPAYKVSPSGGGCEAYLVCFGTPLDGVGTNFTVDVASRELRRDGVGISPNIMDMQAQYGLTAGTPTGPIATWQDPTGSWDGASATTLSQANVKRIKAIRVAIVARSGEYEKPEPGQNCSTTTAAPAIPWPGVNRTFDTTTWPADWQCYRYKVYETVIPLRNAIWAAS